MALGGAVPLAERLKQTHQTMDTVAMFRPVTKYSAEIDSAEAISEALATSFRAAESGRPGAAFLSLDGTYDMVRFQEMAAYGRESGVRFGPVDIVKFAESMGAKGLQIGSADEIGPVLKQAMAMDGPVLVGVPVDYRDNQSLMAALHPDVIH